MDKEILEGFDIAEEGGNAPAVLPHNLIYASECDGGFRCDLLL